MAGFFATIVRFGGSVGAGVSFMRRRRFDAVNGTGSMAWIKRTLAEQSIWTLALGHVRVVTSRGRYILPESHGHLFDANRYLGPYLSSRLSIEQKRSLVLFSQHYSFGLLGQSGMERVCDAVELWSEAGCAIDWRIDLIPSNEGEFVLVFCFHGERLQWLRFTFADAATLGFDAAPAIFVSLIQGKPRSADALRRAAIACGGIRPAYLLLTALNGIADRAGLQSIIGTSNSRLLNQDAKSTNDTLFQYDELWMERGAFTKIDGFYLLSTTARTNVQAIGTPSHRRRAAKRRHTKEAVRLEVIARVGPIFNAVC